MMLPLRADERAARIVALVPILAAERADNEHPADWASARSYGDYVTVLRSMEAWTDGNKWNPIVVAAPRLRPAGDHWTNLSSEVLDAAADRVDTETGDTTAYLRGRMETGATPHETRLVVDHKPNLERVYDDGGLCLAPMVVVYLDGQAYFLDWSLQAAVSTLAALYPHRHGYSGSTYAFQLLWAADQLGVDTVTAQRIAHLVVPDRKSVDAERNTALRILSAEEELEVLATRVGGDPCGECGARPGQPCRQYGCSQGLL